jgi:peptide deformylase
VGGGCRCRKPRPEALPIVLTCQLSILNYPEYPLPKIMAIRPVLKMGDPVLLQVAKPLERFDTHDLHSLLTDMQDTMAALNGAGLAAPQIGVSLQVVIFGVGKNPRYPQAEEVPYTVLINPQLEPVDAAMEDGWEGCLSVPGMRGLVPRYRQLRYRGFDPSGNAIDRTVADFHARVVQHEVDHLNGILYPMRIRDLRNFGFNETLFPDQDLQDD